MTDQPPKYSEKPWGGLGKSGFEDLLEKQQFHFKWAEQSGKNFSEYFSPDETIRDVKENICSRVPGISWTDLKLSIPGSSGPLEDKKTLSECNIPPWARVLISGPPSLNKSVKPVPSLDSPAPGEFEVFVKGWNGQTLTIRVSADSLIKDVKVEIRKKNGLDMHEQRLIFGSKELTDEKRLSDIDVQKYSTIHLVGRLHGGE